MLSTWLRAIRIRFLLASVIAVSNGLAVAYWKYGTIDPLYAVLTYVGVVFLHASVDLLNDYWDYKRGIDSATKRTKFSGGTGVLPENLLTPSCSVHSWHNISDPWHVHRSILCRNTWDNDSNNT